MILAVVGSTLLEGDQEAMALIVHAFKRYRPDGFTSGGADGIDAMAQRYAESPYGGGIAPDRMFIYRPTVRRWGGSGGFMERNLQIAIRCDALVRIVSSRTKTYGSGWTRDRARDLGKPTEDFVVIE